jgi:GTP-binding protein EngB required for normal cell division
LPSATLAPVRLAEVIGELLGKVEIVLAGADEDLRQGEESLAAGDAMSARAAAHRVLAQAPDSPLGLALLADACEAAHLDAELAMTLEELARRAPSRAEVWGRLARARRSTGAPSDEVRDALGRALAVAEAGSEARVDALIGLADLDLDAGDGARAELWLDRAAPAAIAGAPRAGAPPLLLPERASDIAIRSAEARLLRGDPTGARARLDGIQAPATDGRAALVRGRTLAALGDANAFVPLIRALVLDAPGASEALSSALAYVPSDVQTRTRIRSVVDAKGEQGLARWRAAFARAEGARDAARAALREAVASGDRAAAEPLFDAAIEDRDPRALREALAALPAESTDPVVVQGRRLATAFPVEVNAERERAVAALDTLATIDQPRLLPWAEAIAADVAAAWIPAEGPAAWSPLLARLDARAHAIGDPASAARAGDLAADRARPVRLAVVGEFNAGKSTFINALIGADVAPTGVLPTTATLHHLRWAPDAYAKILFAPGHEPRERIVPLADLRAALKSLTADPIERVELRMPLPALVSVEVLDTPGFNAPDSAHTRAARSAFEEADVAIWLLDATQAMKQSERVVLDEARRLRLPVQMLVNKADRLSADELAKVMAAVDAALVETHMGSWQPPVAFSAKRALAARLASSGGAPERTALDAAGWTAVQALLDEQIVGRSAELKERALRRRAAALVARLLEGWTARSATDRAGADRADERARAASRAATRIERDADALAARLAASLEPQAETWKRDLELVFIGRDRGAAERDPLLGRYRVDRAVVSIAPALARAMASLVPEVELPPTRVASHARAIVRAAAFAESGVRFDSRSDSGERLTAIAHAAVATLVEELLGMSVPASAGAAGPGAAGVLRELSAFHAALR